MQEEGGSGGDEDARARDVLYERAERLAAALARMGEQLRTAIDNANSAASASQVQLTAAAFCSTLRQGCARREAKSMPCMAPSTAEHWHTYRSWGCTAVAGSLACIAVQPGWACTADSMLAFCMCMHVLLVPLLAAQAGCCMKGPCLTTSA